MLDAAEKKVLKPTGFLMSHVKRQVQIQRPSKESNAKLMKCIKMFPSTIFHPINLLSRGRRSRNLVV